MIEMDYNDWRFNDPTVQVGQVDPSAQKEAWPPKLDMSKMDTNYWKKTWEGALTEPPITVVDVHPYGDGVEGWTLCDKKGRTCEIIITRKADYERVKKHENMHALGWDHPGKNHQLPGFHSPLDK